LAPLAAMPSNIHACRLVVGFLPELLDYLLEPLERFAAIRPDVELSVRELAIVAQERAVCAICRACLFSP